MIKAIFKILVLSLFIVADIHLAYAQSTQGGLVPNGKTTFLDQNGKPLTKGQVYFYTGTVGSTTFKTTYQDIGLTTPNSNPVVLDAAGRALIWGTGTYRQQVRDQNNNIIWDVITSAAGSGSSGGSTATGDGDLVGTIKPWGGPTAPNQYMFTYGQEVNRTTYAALFTAITSTQSVFCTSGSPTLNGIGDTTNFWIGMKVEIPCVPTGISTVASKTSSTVTLDVNANVSENINATFFMWGNGNGTTTFNLPDFRGLFPIGNNNMGGVASSNISNTYFGSKSANSSGGQGGNQSVVLTTPNLPPYTPNVTVSQQPLFTFQYGGVANGTTTSTSFLINAIAASGISGGTTVQPIRSADVLLSTTAQGGTSTAFGIIPPAKTVNYIIKVTPDANSATANGVTDISGMTGSIGCVSPIVCTGNNITSSGPALNQDLTWTGVNTFSNSTLSAAFTGGGITINPTAGTLKQGFNAQQTISGTTSSNCATGTFQFPCLNLFEITADNVDATLPSNALDGWQFNHTMGGSTLKGARQTVDALANFTSASSSSNSNRNYVALQGQMNVTSSDNGVSGTPAGVFFGANAVVRGSSAATYVSGAVGQESDVNWSGVGLSTRFGYTAASFPSIQGSLADAAYEVHAASGTGAVGWKTALMLTNEGGFSPLDSTSGCVICTDGTSNTIVTGVDLSPYTITGNFLAGPGGNFTVSGSGIASVSDGTARAIWDVSTLFGHSAQIGTSTNHNFDFLTNNILAGYFDTNQALNLGVTGGAQGALKVNGATSGTVTVTTPAVAGTPTLTLPNTSGTFAVGASAPLALNATTGALTCSTCVTSNRMFVSGSSGAAVSPGSTVFLGPQGGLSASPTQNITWLVPFNSTVKNLYFTSATSPGAGQTYTVTLFTGTYNAATASSLTCQITGSNTSCSDLTHTASVTAGQAVVYQIVTSASATSAAGFAASNEISIP